MKRFTLFKELFKNVPFILLISLMLGVTVMARVPRPEHPKPQFYRETWLNLNGEWNFAFDFGVSGVEKGWPEDPSEFNKKIVVPFCPESKL